MRVLLVFQDRLSIFADEELRGVDQAAGQLADVDRSAGCQCRHQAEVVLMGMADEKGVHGKAREVLQADCRR